MKETLLKKKTLIKRDYAYEMKEREFLLQGYKRANAFRKISLELCFKFFSKPAKGRS